jgi:magnesium chelatase family protein
MLARIYAPALLGLESRLIEIECDMTSGLPGFVVVGLGDKAVDEARERVRSAIKNSGLALPPKRLTLNLAPANLPKDGSGYDLGIAVAVLAASGQLRERLDDSLFLGELSLNGDLKPVRGALLAAQLAADLGLRRIYVPRANTTEAALLGGVDVIGVSNLLELYHHLIGMEPLSVESSTTVMPEPSSAEIDMTHIYGQEQAKRALEIAAAGGHNLLLSGPPGAGKTLLAKALIGLLPPPSFEEMIEITKLGSLAGRGPSRVVTQRPLRAPHHTASNVALIGGGNRPRPGEISLAHGGVLFLDELPEFSRSVIEVLRQPLEDRTVTISRASDSVTFPADFMLVATANPCPCGYYGDPVKKCSCSMAVINNYRRRLSGPLLDRIDLVLEVERVDEEAMARQRGGDTTAIVGQRVAVARRRQLDRPHHGRPVLNAALTNSELKRLARPTPQATRLAREAMVSLGLSARAYTRTLKVARTIADIEGSDELKEAHMAEALQYRSRF